MMDLKDERLAKFKSVISKKQFDLTIVLENVHDPHNVGAVVRTCDAVGISEIYLLYTDPNIDVSAFKVGKSSSTGVSKWITKHFYYSVDECFAKVKSQYHSVLGTHLDAKAKNLYDIDLTTSTALVFGNERDGISAETLAQCDGNFLIPQQGMVQSLNISVACAISLYEASRQRLSNGNYDIKFDEQDIRHQQLLDRYIHKHHEKRINKMKTRALQAKKGKE